MAETGQEVSGQEEGGDEMGNGGVVVRDLFVCSNGLNRNLCSTLHTCYI